jgi:3-methyladenine DNA glycosylase AlkC
MGLLKDLYSPAFYKTLAATLADVMPSFNKQRFTSQIFTSDFNEKELKQRMRHTTEVLHAYMPSDFLKAVKILENLIAQLRKKGIGGRLEYIFIPDYIELYGLDDFEISVEAMALITQFVSCEFAVRPFLIRYNQRMVDLMIEWSAHKNELVRRLASEGSRPRLPWAKSVPFLKSDPSSILPILENLKEDDSDFVRRSVANSLNDIAKDHPDMVIGIAKRWKGIAKETDAIIKHGSRTLLKKGYVKILEHYGLKSKNILVSAFKISPSKIKIGGYLGFSFEITNQSSTKQTIRLEYGIYYLKANGQLTRKVFKISEKLYAPNAKVEVLRKQSFKKITTRIFYQGKHQLSIIVNGEEKAVKTFHLI